VKTAGVLHLVAVKKEPGRTDCQVDEFVAATDVVFSVA
jgi:hypothetical protein